MKTAQMSNFWKTFISSFLILLATILVTWGYQKANATAPPAPIVQHGATISKGCTSPKTPGDTTDCQIRVGYNDDAGDTISVDEAWDIQDFGLGHDNVRVPAVGNLPIVAVAGNTTCTVAGALPCKIGPAGSVLSGLPGTASNGSVTFASNTYIIQSNDPDPLPDQGNSNVHDLCDTAASIAHTNGCNTASNTLQFTSQTDIIHPHTTLTKTADPASGRAPLDVTYTYNEKNDGDTAISGVTVSDDKCSPVTYQSGDTNTNGLLDPGETWVFTCKATLNETTTNIATATGTASDQQSAPEERAEATVKVFTVSTELTKVANPSSGVAPLAVTYTYKEKNTGTSPIANVSLSDDKCSPLVRQADNPGNNDNILDPGETWVFTCTHTYTTAGTFTNIVVATGISTIDEKPAPEERAEATVDVKEAPQGCTLTQGFWKNHPDAWPVSSLKLGTVNYTKAQLINILKTPVKGNGLISLAHQLIAAKLNIASGTSSSSIASTIASADALIGSKVVPPVGSGFLSPSSTSSLTGALDNYNSGLTGPGHCAD